MKKCWYVLAVLAWCGAATLAADEKAEPNPLEPLARFVGRELPGGGHGIAPEFLPRVVYKRGLNRKLLKARSYLKGDEGERLVYESVFYWHPGKKKTVFTSVAADGGIFEGTVQPAGDLCESFCDSYTSDKLTMYLQIIRFSHDDHTGSMVFAKKGDEWVKVIGSKQQRKR
jgi:hypothetical protein